MGGGGGTPDLERELSGVGIIRLLSKVKVAIRQI